MREYLDPVVKDDQSAQYVDDIRIAANNATDLTGNIRAVFKCICQGRLKLTIEKCHFEVRKVEFLGRTISPEGISPQALKIQSFFDKLRFPKSKKSLQRHLGFVTYYRNFIPIMAEKLNPFYKLLKTEVPINITPDLKETFDSVNKPLKDACQLALKQPIPGKQLVLMTDASFRSAGYALMIEDNPDQRIQSKQKTYAPVAFGSKIFSPAQLKMSGNSKIYGCQFGIFRVCTHSVGSNKANNCPNRQQVSHTFFPNEGNSASTLECMWLCAAIQFQNSTNCWFSQHCGQVSLQNEAQSHGEDTSQNPGRYPNNTYRGDNLFLWRRWWKTIFLHTSRQQRWVRRTNPWTERKM